MDGRIYRSRSGLFWWQVIETQRKGSLAGSEFSPGVQGQGSVWPQEGQGCGEKPSSLPRSSLSICLFFLLSAPCLQCSVCLPQSPLILPVSAHTLSQGLPSWPGHAAFAHLTPCVSFMLLSQFYLSVCFLVYLGGAFPTRLPAPREQRPLFGSLCFTWAPGQFWPEQALHAFLLCYEICSRVPRSTQLHYEHVRCASKYLGINLMPEDFCTQEKIGWLIIFLGEGWLDRDSGNGGGQGQIREGRWGQLE